MIIINQSIALFSRYKGMDIMIHMHAKIPNQMVYCLKTLVHCC